MTKKAKRTALLQRTEEIAELRKENEQLKARLAEHGKVEKAPRRSQELLRAFMDSSTDAFTVYDSHLNLIDLNEAALLYLAPGVRKEEVIGKNLADFITDRERHVPYLKVMETGEPLVAEETFVLPTVGEFTVVTRAFRVGDGIGIVTTDITARKRMENEVKRSEERYRLLADNASDVIWVTDMDLNLTYVSPSAMRMLGCSKDELMTPLVRDLLLPDTVRSRIESLREQTTAATRRPSGLPLELTLETKLRLKDGSIIWVEDKINFIRDAANRLTGIMGITREITDRREAEEELRASEERSRLLLENANEGIAVVQSGILKFANPKLAELSGYSVQDLISKPFSQLIHPDDVPIVMDHYARRLKGEELTRVYTIRVIGKTGDMKWGEVNAVLIDWEGEPAVLAIVNDITERRTAEESLRQSEEKYRALAEQSIQGIVIAQGLPPRFVYCNRALAEMAGYTVDEMLSLTAEQVINIIHPDDQAVFFKRFEDRVKGLPAEGYHEFRAIRKDGSVLWLESFSSVVQYQGQPAVQATFVNLTQRRKAEELLRASEEKYRMVVNNANEAIGVAQDGVWKFANPKLTEISGYTAEELLVKPFFELAHPDDRQTVVERSVRRMKGEEAPSNYQVRFVDKAGNIGWTEISVNLIDWEGRPAILALMMDITPRKKAEEALLASEQKYRGMFDESIVAIYVFDAKLNFIDANQAGIDLLGYPREELLRMSTEDVDAEPLAVPRVQSKLFSGERLVNWEHSVRRKDGSVITVLNNSRPLTDAGGNVVGILSTLVDVTERKQAEQALRRSEERYRLVFENSPVSIWEENLYRVKAAMDSLKKEGVAEIEAYFDQHPGTIQQWAEMVEIVDVNQATLVLHGAVSKEELLAGLVNTFTPESFDTFRRELVCLWNGGTSMTTDAVVRTIAGHPRYVTVSFSVALGFEESLSKVLVTIADITERKQAEQALQESEARFRSLSEAAEEGIAIHDVGIVVEANEALARMFGYELSELIGMNAERLSTPETWRLIVKHMASGSAEPYEGQGVRKDGSTFWCSLVGKPYQYKGKTLRLGAFRNITERKKAEEKLRESEQRFRSLVENSHAGIFIIGDDFRFAYANEMLCTILGYPQSEVIGADFRSFLDDDSKELVADRYVRRRKGEDVPTRYEFNVVRKSGEKRRVEISATVAEDLAGRPMTLAQILDVTERKLAEEALRESEARFRRLSEAAEEGIAIHDRGIIVEANEAFARMFGYQLSELIGMNAERLSTPESWRVILKHIASESEEPYEAEGVKKDGSTFWCSLVGKPYQYKGRNLRLSAFRDITKRKQAEESLQRGEQRFRAIAENSSDVIVMVNREGGILYESPAIRNVLGFSAEERIGASVFGLMHQEDLPLVTVAFQELLRNPKAPVQRAEVRLRHKDGSWRMIEASGSSVVRGSTVEAVVINLHDVTERKQAEHALKERLKELRCIADISRLAEKPELPIEEFVQGAVSMLPPAWQYPEVCGARITLDSEEFKTANYRETEWIQSADIRVDGKRFGTVTICYVEEKPEEDEGPFLKEERDLINTVADFLGHVVQHRQMEESLRASEERYRLLAENATDVIWTMDMNFRYTYVSPSTERLTGYSVKETMAQSLEEALTPASYEAVTRMASEELAGEEEGGRDIGRSRMVEVELKCKDGSAVWVEVQATLLRDAAGKAVGILGVSRDITERKRADEQLQMAHADLELRVEQRTAELREANALLLQEIRQRQEAQDERQETESKYRDLVENANSIILELDTGGKISFLNRFAQEFFGFTEAEIVGRHVVGTIVPPTDSEGNDLKLKMKDITKHPEDHYVSESEGIRQDGKRVWISWTNKGLYDKKGRLRRILCIGMDRTEQRQVAVTLAQQEKEKAAAAERQRLARDLHDAVTQTLFSASLIAEVLPRLWEKDQAEGERRLEELRRLTRGALAEMRMLLLELRPAALGEVGLADLLHQLGEAITGRTTLPVALSIRGKCTAPLDVQVALYRVAQEALNNVVKHSGATKANVRLYCRENSADLTISDNGAGFDLQAVSPKSLGISIMRERAEAAGAKLRIESRAGLGTKVGVLWSGAARKGGS